MIHLEQIKTAKEVTETLMIGAQIDCFQVYSTVLNISFNKLPKAHNLPVNLWLSATGKITFLETENAASNEIKKLGKSDDFFDSREKLLGQLYRLIGKEIIEIDIDPSGVLELHLGSGNLIFAGDEVNFEEIWSVTSDTPEPYANHDWAVTLTDERQLVTRKP